MSHPERGSGAATQPSASSGPGEPLWTRNFILVILANLVIFTSFQMLLPTIPVYVEHMGGQAAIQGLVIGVFTFSANMVRPFVGWALDSVGRKLIFLFGLFVFVLSALLYIWTPSVTGLFVIRFIHGFGWGFSTTAAGTIASDFIPKKRLGTGMGVFGLASTMAMAIGPALGLFIIGRSTFNVLFYVCSGFAFLALLLGMSIKYPQQPKTDPMANNKLTRSKFSFFEKKAIAPATVMLLSNTTFGAIVTFVALYAMQRGIANIGIFFIVYAATLAITRPLAGMLLDHDLWDAVVVIGLSSVAGAMVLLSQAQSLGMFLLVGLIYGVGFGAIQPSMQALSVREIPFERRGAANGTFYIGFDLGIGIGAIMWGVVSQATGFSIMYLVAAVPALLALAAYVVAARPHKQQLP